MNRLINRYFKLSENQTSTRQEILGGLTTFVTMSYIIVVNPQILAHAGACIYQHAGYPARIQHRHGAQPGPDFQYSSQGCSGEVC
jgi:xanthine/uracil/vitamin C permease (AzgA family)